MDFPSKPSRPLSRNFVYAFSMEEEQQSEIEQTSSQAATPEQPPAVVQTTGGEATLGQRIGAGLIDVLVASAAGFVAGKIAGGLAFAVQIAYMLTRDSLPFLDGQSIGKKALNLRAVTEDGKSLSGNWNTGLLRNISMAVPFLPLVELIIMIVNNGKPGGLRRLGDQWAKTKVVTTAP
jgi:uncharacterized RDD family membrane protein YckC